MDFVIIGAGSVGGYFGARLQQAGQSVTFLVRPRRRELLLRDRLRIRSPLGNVELRVQAEAEADAIPRCDVVVVAVRNYDLDEVLPEVAYFAKSGAQVISFLNGVEHVEKIRKIVSDKQIMGGTAYIDSRLGPDGEIIHRSQIPTVSLGNIDSGPPSITREVASIFTSAGIKAQIAENLIEELWQKYLFVMLGSYTAVVNAPIGVILGSPWCSKTLMTLLEELLIVAKTGGVNLDNRHAEVALAEVRRQRSEWTSLVCEDLQKHRKTEIDSLWGYVVRKAEEHGIVKVLSNRTLG
jgi:2-dehydropantoate 2-reductase